MSDKRPGETSPTEKQGEEKATPKAPTSSKSESERERKFQGSEIAGPQHLQLPQHSGASPTEATATGTSASSATGREPGPTAAATPQITVRPVIAVSASKGPAAFFNLARKFLATDEMCDLSALEGAIVSAVDAAHLLERSKLATIAR